MAAAGPARPRTGYATSRCRGRGRRWPPTRRARPRPAARWRGVDRSCDAAGGNGLLSVGCRRAGRRDPRGARARERARPRAGRAETTPASTRPAVRGWAAAAGPGGRPRRAAGRRAPLGSTLDASMSQPLRTADALGDFYSLVERRRRGLLQPGVRACMGERVLVMAGSRLSEFVVTVAEDLGGEIVARREIIEGRRGFLEPGASTYDRRSSSTADTYPGYVAVRSNVSGVRELQIDHAGRHRRCRVFGFRSGYRRK